MFEGGRVALTDLYGVRYLNCLPEFYCSGQTGWKKLAVKWKCNMRMVMFCIISIIRQQVVKKFAHRIFRIQTSIHSSLSASKKTGRLFSFVS